MSKATIADVPGQHRRRSDFSELLQTYKITKAPRHSIGTRVRRNHGGKENARREALT
jgi:hypothetical protein